MSPTTILAQLDHLSPVEDLDLDEVDVSLMSEENETPRTTTPVGETSGLVADKCGKFPSITEAHYYFLTLQLC